MTRHKNKTIATFLATTFGFSGAHRFYLFGVRDFWAWAHLIASLSTLLAFKFDDNSQLFFIALPLIFSLISSFIEALVIGLTADHQWDGLHNHNSGRQSNSRWPLALLLVFTTGIGAVTLIATMARTFDLLYTGGAYG